MKSKYNQLVSGNKVPASLTAMESSLKKNEKELKNLENQYNETINQIGQKQIDLEWAIGVGDDKQVSSINMGKNRLDSQSVELATQLENARDKSEKLKRSLEELKVNTQASMEVQNLKAKIDLMSSSLETSKKEANDLLGAIEKSGKEQFKGFGIDSSSIGEGFEKIGAKLDKFKNKMSRLIGTAMVFSLIRQGLNSLSRGFINLLKTNGIFSNSLNQIKANLMTAFTPIYNAALPAINALMEAISKLTGTIAIFIANLFGVSLSDAKKQAQGLSNALEDVSQSGEEANESLAGFDKLEVNSDEKSKSKSSGVTNSSIDYSGDIAYSQKLLDILNGIKDFISNYKEELLGFLVGLIGGIIALQLGLSKIKSLGIGVMILGIIALIQSIINYLNDPCWENFGKIIQGIGISVLGLGIIIGNTPLKIAGAIALIISLISSNWEKIKQIINNAIQWIYNNLNSIKEKFGLFGVFISSILANLLEWFIHTFEDIFGGLKKVLDGIIDFVAGVFTGDWERAWNGVKKIVSGIFQSLLGIVKSPLNSIIALLNGLIDGINFCINGINKISFDIPDWVPGIGGKTLGFNIPNIGKIPMLAQGAVIPPNNKFAAVLGDQRTGTNLEAPESLIRKIVREESGGTKDIILRNATFIIQAETGEEFGRASIASIRLCEEMDGKPYFV